MIGIVKTWMQSKAADEEQGFSTLSDWIKARDKSEEEKRKRLAEQARKAREVYEQYMGSHEERKRAAEEEGLTSLGMAGMSPLPPATPYAPPPLGPIEGTLSGRIGKLEGQVTALDEHFEATLRENLALRKEVEGLRAEMRDLKAALEVVRTAFGALVGEKMGEGDV